MSLKRQFDYLDHFLISNKHLWQLQAFHHCILPFEQPQLCDSLNQLDQTQLQNLQQSPEELHKFLKPFLAAEVPQLTFIQRHDHLPLSYQQQRFISEQKQQQIGSMGFWQPAKKAVVEWCAGKGHLGRFLADEKQCNVLSIEYNEELCQQGQILADKQQLNIEYLHKDVHCADIENISKRYPSAQALHACGDLHLSLIKSCDNFEHLTIVPCCYHLTEQENYHPISEYAQKSQLQLHKSDLSLCVKEVVTGSAKTAIKNDQKILWRMAFNAWYKESYNDNEYLSLPTIKDSQLSQGVECFFIWAAKKKSLTLSDNIDYEAYLEQGATRLQTIRRIEVVQHFFKPFIEQWLNIDKAIFLQEHGFDVDVFECWPKHISPRNTMLVAKRCEHE